MKRILLVKTSSLGDVIHNLPVIDDLLQHYPDAQIDWVVEQGFADIPRMHPKVHHVIEVALRQWRKQFFSKQILDGNFRTTLWSAILQSKQALKQQPYDVIIDTQGLIKSAFIACLAQGERHGYDRLSIREPLASMLYHHQHSIAYQQHAVTRNRALVANSLAYALPSTAPNYGLDNVRQQKNNEQIPYLNSDELPLENLNHSYVLGLHGTSQASKLWPESHWLALAQAIAPTPLLLPWATNAEQARAQRLAQAVNNVFVLAKSSIAQLAAVIIHAKYAIGVDTGLTHLSAALNIPTLALYTDTNPAYTGVMAGSKAPVINLGNQKHTPSVHEVFNAIESLLA